MHKNGGLLIPPARTLCTIYHLAFPSGPSNQSWGIPELGITLWTFAPFAVSQEGLSSDHFSRCSQPAPLENRIEEVL